MPAPQTNPLHMELAMGSIGINSVQIYNTSNGNVRLYPGSQSPTGTPAYVIPPLGNVTVNPGGQNYITATCDGTSGNYTATWTDQWLVAMATSVPTVAPNQTQFNLLTNLGNTSPNTFNDATWGPIAGFALSGQPSPLIAPSANPSLYVQEIWVSGLPPYVRFGFSPFYHSGGVVSGGWLPIFEIGEEGRLIFPAANPFKLVSIGANAGDTLFLSAVFNNYDDISQISNSSLLCGVSGYLQ